MTVDRAHELMQDPAIGEVLQSILTGEDGTPLPGFWFELDRIHHRADADVSALYRLGYHLPSAAQPTEDWIGLTTVAVETGASVTMEGITLAAWRHPDDPRLPGLAEACVPATVAQWLGVDAVDLEMLAYRPLRRAVLGVAGPVRAFVKVLRPSRFDVLLERQRLLSDAGLSPAVLAVPAPGVLVTAAATGRPLAEALLDWGRTPDALPEPQSLVDLLDALPAAAMDLPKRDAWADRVDFHAAGAAATVPWQAAEIESLAQEISALVREAPVGPVIPTHGDFYEANVFIEGTEATTLIDVDSLGPGLREDDLSCMLGHLAVLPDLAPEQYRDLVEVVEVWREDFEERVDAAALRARTAAVILSLVSGADLPRALARLDLARAWAARARAARPTS